MILKKNETTTQYSKVAAILGLQLHSTCQESNGECTMGGCYCNVIKRLTLNAVIGIIIDDKPDAAITLFHELAYTGATMIDCADFIHRVREKDKELRGALHHDSETPRPNL